MRQGHTSTMLMRQCLNTITYLRKKIKPLPPESELSDSYRPSENQKNGKLLFAVGDTGIATYALYKYLK